MKTKSLLATLLLSACVNPPPASSMQSQEVTEGTVRALTSVSGDRTGITYGLGQPPDDGMPQTLRLTSVPFAGLIRQYDFPQVAGILDIGLTNYPPDTNQPSRFAAGAAGRSPLVTVAANTPDDGHPDGSLTTQVGEGRVRATTVAIPAGPPLIEVGIPAGPPLITVSIPAGPPLTPGAADPPDDSKVAFGLTGSNYRIVGTGSVDGARLDFQVLDAEGRVVFDSAGGQ